MAVVKKIVITGGPGGGKTSSKSAILEAVLKCGYIPIFIGESATEAKSTGLDPVTGVISPLDFQIFITKLQIFKEELYLGKLESLNDKFVVFYDRGVIDGKAYLSKREWEILKNEVDITDAEISKRYDLVLHLVSAAEGAEEYYQWNDPDVDEVGNNEVRSESPEEARIQEIKNKDAYLGFPYIYYFGNETNFDEKVNKVVGTVMSSIGMGKPILGSKKRYLVSKIDKKVLEEIKAQSADIEQYYLEPDKEAVEKRARKTTYSGNSIFTYTKKDKDNLIISEESITEGEYNLLRRERKSLIKKKRWYFNFNNLYFQYDEFDFEGDFENYGFLEVQTTELQSEVVIPECFNSYFEITNNELLTSYRMLTDEEVRKNIANIALTYEMA